MPTVTMSALWLKKLQATDKRQVDYFDDKQPGLCLRLGKSGTKAFAVVYRVKGSRKKRRVTIGRFPALSLADARKKARQIMIDAERGKDAAQKKQELLQAPTFKELCGIYLEKHAIHKRSYKEDKRKIETDLLRAWGNVKAHDVKRRDVLMLLDKIVDRGSPISANRTLALIRKIYNFGIERDLVESNPCAMVKAPGREKQRDRVLNSDEIRKLWTAFDEVLTPAMANIQKLRLITAQRGIEVCSLQWQDIDFETGWWTIPAGISKNKMAHRVPLSGMALDIIQEQQKKNSDSEWVFPSRKQTAGHVRWFQRSFNKARAHSGLEDVTMHDLRRTAASLMTGMGISRLVVSKILNHAEHGVTHVYDRHGYDAEKRAALEKWAARLEQILSGKQGKVVNLR